MHHQFSAGIQVCDFNYAPCLVIKLVFMFHDTLSYSFLQTIAVIPVLPHGVVQLGSFLPVSLLFFLLFSNSGEM